MNRSKSLCYRPLVTELDSSNKVCSRISLYCLGHQRSALLPRYIEYIYCRKIVSYEIHEQECGERAVELIHHNMLRERCFNNPLVLSYDSGAQMQSLMMKRSLKNSVLRHH